MCGIAGFVDPFKKLGSDRASEVIRTMTDRLIHRGPDAAGVYLDQEAGLALGHRRLSILDLSPNGSQPMASTSGRFTIVFNGEIYNFSKLRDELRPLGHAFKGGSDTEVILAAVEQWGLKEALVRFQGMFAFALWDGERRELKLARDRTGEKPLYYGWCGDSFVFASELKALEKHPAWKGDIDRDSLASFFRFSCIPAPHSIYGQIRKLPPATFLGISPSRVGELPEPEPYWSAVSALEQGQRNPFTGTLDEATVELERLMLDVVGAQMVADVPLGAFLSGGIDSSLIVALMQKQSARPIQTFTIGFSEDGFNEAAQAKEVARHLKTSHTELYLDAATARSVIPKLPMIYDEPFSDPSQIPTYLVAGLARRSVTVALSGDGGDELFGGYNRYVWGPRLWDRLKWIPRPLRAALGDWLSRLSPAFYAAALKTLGLAWPRLQAQPQLIEKIYKSSEVMGAGSPEELYYGLVSHWKRPLEIVQGASVAEKPTLREFHRSWQRRPDFTLWMQLMDVLTYLPDDILTKVDRAGMAVSLESRIPFLDHRVIEFAWRLPQAMRIDRGSGKQILRRLLYRHVPRELVERPKAGFAIPIGSWLRGPLRDWAEALLDETRLNREGYLNSKPIRSRWREHLAGARDWEYQIWDILMFQAWLEARKN